ncbi:MAG: thioredoxin domain-containing protein [Anaerolineaceae bacterium]|nr:thioredoxin domain-containing protein [Anaerolineaceae bacterium]
MVAIVGVVALLLIALFIFGNQPAAGEIPLEARERYSAIPQGQSEEGFPALGAMEAPVTLKLFTSFDCSNCASQGELIHQLLPRFAEAMDVSFQFIPIVADRMLEFQNAEFATKFALCANPYQRFWEYQEALYAWQTYAQRAYSSARLADGIENLGLNRSEVEDCVRGRFVTTILDAAIAAADAQLSFGQYGFPLFVVNLEPILPSAPGELPTLEQIHLALDRALEEAATTQETESESEAAAVESEADNLQETEHPAETENDLVTSEPTSEPTGTGSSENNDEEGEPEADPSSN